MGRVRSDSRKLTEQPQTAGMPSAAGNGDIAPPHGGTVRLRRPQIDGPDGSSDIDHCANFEVAGRQTDHSLVNSILNFFRTDRVFGCS
jgi:hypothetical protein